MIFYEIYFDITFCYLILKVTIYFSINFQIFDSFLKIFKFIKNLTVKMKQKIFFRTKSFERYLFLAYFVKTGNSLAVNSNNNIYF